MSLHTYGFCQRCKRSEWLSDHKHCDDCLYIIEKCAEAVAEERARILKLLRVDWHRYGSPEDFIEQNSSDHLTTPGSSGKGEK